MNARAFISTGLATLGLFAGELLSSSAVALGAPPAVGSESASSITRTGATLEAQINPNNEATTCKFEYGTSATLLGAASTACEPPTVEGFGEQSASANLAGLSPNTVYFYRTAAENGAGKAENVPIQEFRSLPSLPTAITGEASNVTKTAATVMGTINPGSTGSTASEAFYFFEYSTGAIPEAFECNAPCVRVPSFPGVNAGQGTSDVPETAALPGPEPLLAPNTVYHYRIVAYNGNGAFNEAFGADRELKTLPLAPAATTDPPVAVGSGSATIAGEVVPQCVEGRYPPTTYRFEYGTTTAYGAGSEEADVAASSCATGGEAVTDVLAGLLPNTIYHYRLDARNSGGETEGKDRTFTSDAVGGPISTVTAGFSLIGIAAPATAVLAYPNLQGVGPIGTVKESATPNVLTDAQKLVRALKACKAKSRKRRSDCELRARKAYRSVGKKKARGNQRK